MTNDPHLHGGTGLEHLHHFLDCQLRFRLDVGFGEIEEDAKHLWKEYAIAHAGAFKPRPLAASRLTSARLSIVPA
jgi:hypothetical protein